MADIFGLYNPFLGLAQEMFAPAHDILGLTQGILGWFNIFRAGSRYFWLAQDIFGWLKIFLSGSSFFGAG